MTGIIYCYTSPVGKKYVGQTRDEERRRWCWMQVNRNYCHGGKIDRARKKYGPENFTYEILHKFECDTLEELIKEMNKWEIFFIAFFDSYHNGYNSTRGGQSTDYRKNSEALKGHKLSEETKEKIRKKAIGRKLILTEEVIAKRQRNLKERCNKIVLQYSLDGSFIKEWESITSAAEAMGCARCLISDCWTKNIHSAVGYIWKLKDPSKYKKTSAKNRWKAVLKYDLNGNFIQRYDSLKLAAEDSPGDCYSNISACCLGKSKSAVGYIWKYE